MAAAISLAALGGCRLDSDAFYDRLFSCDVAAASPSCGTDRNDRPMTCYGARQIGAADFCAESCEGMSMADDAVCLDGIAKVRRCAPSRDGSPAMYPAGACGRRELACLRTDLTADEGVCLPLQRCDVDADCRDPARSTCASTVLDAMYGRGSGLKSDHLYCLQVGCHARRAACAPGETCLLEVIGADPQAPDICSPNCDSNLRCPPNHVCFRKVFGPFVPAICAPGLAGFPCDGPNDCIAGDCLDPGVGTKLCSPACSSDDDCRRFDGNGPSLCNPSKRCVFPDNVVGPKPCMSDAQCRGPGERCVQNPAGPGGGMCAVPCDADRSCKPLAGVNHTCAEMPPAPGVPAGICVPGTLGRSCTSNAGCVGGLACQIVQANAPRICTLPCTSDAECRMNRWTARGWCLAARNVCMPAFSEGAECERDAQCESRQCSLAAGKKVCAPRISIGGMP